MIMTDERNIATAEKIRVSSTGPLPVLIRSANGINRVIWHNKRRMKRRTRPEKYFIQNNLAVVIGWVRRNDLVLLVNSLVKEIEPRNREKRIGRIM